MVEKTQHPGWWPEFYQPFRQLGERLADWFAPRSEARSAGAAYRIAVELPGIAREDVEITLDDGVLTVTGEKRSERTEEGDTWFFSEREYGRFRRSFRLPADADGENVTAELGDGLLRISVPRRSRGTAGKKIELK